MAEDVTTSGPALQRRRVLIGAGAAGLAGVLAACGDDNGDTSAGAGEPTSQSSPDGGNEPADSADTGEPETSDDEDDAAEDGSEDGSEGTEDGDGAAAGLVAAAEVPVGGGVILDEEEIVITQPSEGEFMGFSSRCTHLGCAVADVSDGLIRCPCHGSRYFIEDGTVENGPATQPLSGVEISEQDGQIVQG